MNSPTAYYLLLIYLLALCKPVLPLVQDTVAHTFFEHQHLATVHQRDGSSHVKEEIGELAEKGSADENNGCIKLFDSVPLHLAASCGYQFSFEKPVTLSHHNDYCCGLPSLSLSVQLPPPRM